MKWNEIYKRIISSRNALKSLLKEKATERGNVLLIQDPPIEIEIKDNEIRFMLEGELSAVLDEGGLTILDDVIKEEVKYWCIALSSLGFKRYRIKYTPRDL